MHNLIIYVQVWLLLYEIFVISLEDLAASSGENAGCAECVFQPRHFSKKARSDAQSAFTLTSKATVPIPTHLVRQNLLPERSTEIQRLQHRVTVAGVSKLKQKEADGKGVTTDGGSPNMADAYIDQSKVVFVNGKLFRSNLLFQGRGIGALQEEEEEKKRQS